VRIRPQIEEVLSHPPNIVQATNRHPTSIVLRNHRSGDQFYPRPGAGSGTRPIYFISKLLQGSEVRYQAIEKAALAVVFSARRLRHYFQSFTVILMTDMSIRKVLQKPDVPG